MSAYLGGKDGHRDDEIRGLLAPLAKLAADHRVAVVMVTHLSKSGGARALYRAMGSLAFAAAARAAYLVVRDEAQHHRRFFLPMKNNIGNDSDGFAYSIRGDGMRASVCWEKTPLTISADDALAAAGGDKQTPGPEPEALNAAIEWLGELLASGALEARQVEKEAKAAGVSWASVRRAKVKMGVKSYREQFGGAWRWKSKATRSTAGTGAGPRGRRAPARVLTNVRAYGPNENDTSILRILSTYAFPHARTGCGRRGAPKMLRFRVLGRARTSRHRQRAQSALTWRRTMDKQQVTLVKPKKHSRRRAPLCTCNAYPWPHRPTSGACRWPDPPLEPWRGSAGRSKPSGARIDRGVRRRLAGWMGWHPVRDRAYIRRWMPKLYVAYCRRLGYPGGDNWLTQHGVAGIPAMRVTPDGYDSLDRERVPVRNGYDEHVDTSADKSERAPCGTPDCPHGERAPVGNGDDERAEGGIAETERVPCRTGCRAAMWGTGRPRPRRRVSAVDVWAWRAEQDRVWAQRTAAGA